MHHMMIIISIMAIRRITIKMIMTPQETGIMIPEMRNMKMIILMDLIMMMIMIQMVSSKLKKILL